MGSIKQIPFDLFLFHVLLTLHAYYFTNTMPVVWLLMHYTVCVLHTYIYADTRPYISIFIQMQRDFSFSKTTPATTATTHFKMNKSSE